MNLMDILNSINSIDVVDDSNKYSGGIIGKLYDYSIGTEARNIRLDRVLRINKTSVFVAEKNITERSLVFSFAENGLQLFSDIKNKKSNLFVARLRGYFMPKHIRLKLPSKSIVKNLMADFNKVRKEKANYGVSVVLNNPDLIKNDSYVIDMNYLHNAIYEKTLGVGLKANPKLRASILEVYKTYITDTFVNSVAKNKIIYFESPILSDTKIKLVFNDSIMMYHIKPALLFMEWFYKEPEEFKAWLADNNISMVFGNNVGHIFAFSGSPSFLKMNTFKPKLVMRFLHMIDKHTEVIDDPELDEELDEDEKNEVIAMGDTPTDEELYDNDNVSLPDEDDYEDEVLDVEEEIPDDEGENLSHDMDAEFNDGEDLEEFLDDENLRSDELAVPISNIIKNKEIEEDINEIEIAEDETSNLPEKRNYYKILENSDMTEEEKAAEIIEEHNGKKLRESVETNEVKALRKNMVKKYGKDIREVVNNIKKHTIKDTELGLETKQETKFNKSTTYKMDNNYKEILAKDDLENILTSPANMSYPVILKSYTTKDISDREFKGYELTVEYETHNGEPITIKLDIPETVDDNGNLFMGGSHKHLKFQNAAKPIVKQDESVIITTAYNKVIISMTGKYSSVYTKMFITRINAFYKLLSDSEKVILKPKTTDELGDFIYENRIGYNLFCLNRFYVGMIGPTLDIDFRGRKVDKGLTLLGTYNNEEVYHDPVKDTITYNKRSFKSLDFIGLVLEESYSEKWNKTKMSRVTTSQLTVPTARIMGKSIPVILVILIAMPLKELLEKMKDENGLEYKVVKNTADVNKFYSNEEYGVIRFSDYSIILKYNNNVNALLFGYLTMMDLSNKDIFDITNVMETFTGNPNTALYIENFIDLFIDPMTKRVCDLYGIPNDFVGMFIYAVSLFTSHITMYKSDIRNYRLITQTEIINRCIYDVISKELSDNAARMKRGSRSRITLSQDAVIARIRELPTLSEANNISAFREIMDATQVSFKGHVGINEDRAYNDTLRMFNKNNYGTETCATAYSGNAGITKYLPFNPCVTDMSGSYEHHDGPEDLGSESMMAFSDAYTPYTRFNHPVRRLMQSGQFLHIIPSMDSDPMIVSSYADESAIKLSPRHAVNAKDDGVIKEVNDKFIIIQYKDKTIDAIPLENVERNTDKGYFLKNDFVPTKDIKTGTKIQKGQVLAYSKDSFKMKANGGIGLSAGVLCWVVISDGPNQWEDSALPSAVLSDRLATRVVKRIARTIDLNTDIRDWNIDIGTEVQPTDILFKYKLLTDDTAVNDIFMNVDGLYMKEVDAKWRGKLVDIRLYYRAGKDTDISAPVKKFIRAVDDIQRVQNKMGILENVTDQFTKAYNDRRPQKLSRGKMSKINGDNIENGKLLIEYYIEIEDKLGAADKIVLDNALKGEPAGIIPKEDRPVGFDTNRKIDLCYSTYSLVKRMTPGLLLHGQLTSILLHNKRKCMQILGIEPNKDTLMDYYSSPDIKKGKYK